MKNSRLLENLENKISGDVNIRRYALSEIISESYKAFYKCKEGSNLQKIAEAHLQDVRTNPTEIDRLSTQLCNIQHLIKMTESAKLNDEDLVDKEDIDEVEPKKSRVLNKECNEGEAPKRFSRYKAMESCAAKRSSLKEEEDPELTDEEVEELAKHLETIRKERKATAPAKKEEVEEGCDSKKESVAPSRGIRCSTHKKVNEVEDPSPDLQDHIMTTLADVIYDFGVEPNDLGELLDELVYNIAKMMPAKNESKNTGSLGTKIDDQSSEMTPEACEKELFAFFDKWSSYIDIDNIEAAWRKYVGSMNESKNTGALGAKIGDVIIDTKTGKEGTVKKLGTSGNYSLLYVDFGNGLRKINPMDDAQTTGRYTLKESKKVTESYKGLESFSKNSSSKAFYKTFKKMHGALKEGKALTRQESMNLYKAANSAMTQLSVELEHNPEFLKTFNECTTLLSADVNKLLESMKNGKAPSKNTMKSLAKFSEALLNESDLSEGSSLDKFRELIMDDATLDVMKKIAVELDIDTDEDPTEEEAAKLIKAYYGEYDESKKVNEVEEDEEDIDAPDIEDDEFIGDDEGDVQSEEADEFDQEYADARVEMHKDLADEHADSEDPEVQEKLEQDAADVKSLPGITDEQIAELDGESPEPEEEPDEEPVPDEDDEDITDDELAELKNHLKEMRAARKSN